MLDRITIGMDKIAKKRARLKFTGLIVLYFILNLFWGYWYIWTWFSFLDIAVLGVLIWFFAYSNNKDAFDKSFNVNFLIKIWIAAAIVSVIYLMLFFPIPLAMNPVLVAGLTDPGVLDLRFLSFMVEVIVFVLLFKVSIMVSIAYLFRERTLTNFIIAIVAFLPILTLIAFGIYPL